MVWMVTIFSSVYTDCDFYGSEISSHLISLEEIDLTITVARLPVFKSVPSNFRKPCAPSLNPILRMYPFYSFDSITACKTIPDVTFSASSPLYSYLGSSVSCNFLFRFLLVSAL